MTAANDPTIRRLVYGTLWPGFLGRTVPDWLARSLEQGLAGAVYFSHNLQHDHPGQAARLSADLRGFGGHVLIGVDEEGGGVSRLHAAAGSPLPSHAQLGALDDPGVTRRVGASLGASAARAGINVVLAPVADVNTNPLNPVIGVRSFGSNPGLVSRHVAALASGIQSAGVAACAKHFPGHGDTHLDSHLELPHFAGDHATLLTEHLPPFYAAVAAGVRAIMTTHVVVPSLGDLPCTLNPDAISLLRANGFQGPIITDALDMAAIRSRWGLGGGAVAALAAGADLLCVGNPANPRPGGGAHADVKDFVEAYRAICAALDDGYLSVERLDDACRRNADMARASDPTRQIIPPVDAADSFRPSVRQAIVGTITSTKVGELPRLAPGDPVTVIDIRETPHQASSGRRAHLVSALREHYRVSATTVPASEWGSPLTPGGHPCEDLEAPLTLVVADSLHLGTPQRAVAHALCERAGGRALVVNLGIRAQPPCNVLVIDALGDSRVTAEALTELLSPLRTGAA